jgi:signal transduction histidine kinase
VSPARRGTLVPVKGAIGRGSERTDALRWGELADSLVKLVTSDGRPTPEAAAVITAARERASALGRAAGGDAAALGLAALELVADIVCGLLVERDWSRDEVDSIVQGTARRIGLPVEAVGLGVFARAVTERHLVDLPPDLALEAQLRLFLAFAPAMEASLWARAGDPPALACVVHVGEREPTRASRAAAQRVLDGGLPDGGRPTAEIHALPVVRWDHPEAALVLRTRRGHGGGAIAFAGELAPRLVPTLERRALLARVAARERSLSEATERRLARLGLDLHDGPIQDVIALGSEVRLFRTQLARALDEHEHGPILLGRVDDVDARLVALDRELRELARSLESHTILKEPLPDLVRQELEAFRGRAGIAADLDVEGTFDALTPSQGIALLRIVQEALHNVELHSGAGRVQVALVANERELRAEITDDGRGFDVEPRLIQAAREGHLGLVGMGERVRLLGGRFDIQSKRGGPTRVSATIPRWTPPS